MQKQRACTHPWWPTVEWGLAVCCALRSSNITDRLMHWGVHSSDMLHAKLCTSQARGDSRGKSQVTAGHFQLCPARQQAKRWAQRAQGQRPDCWLLWRTEEGDYSWSEALSQKRDSRAKTEAALCKSLPHHTSSMALLSAQQVQGHCAHRAQFLQGPSWHKAFTIRTGGSEPKLAEKWLQALGTQLFSLEAR